MVIAFSGLAIEAQERTDIERRGLFSRIFNKDDQTKNPGPGYNEKVHGVYMDRETDTVSLWSSSRPEIRPVVKMIPSSDTRRSPVT